ncbi:hypothetical protein OG698_47840 (plasmid) [Streptomyces sp. NBC_01003]|uniref:hypothetical protein n=1 Tax=Streptomyces sp. NBC_01003 TaxID=2903714 RepID=UPI002F9096F9|nr:hypothetical protein OG698_47840 [Streptomyces sp. NBC_01003]
MSEAGVRGPSRRFPICEPAGTTHTHDAADVWKLADFQQTDGPKPTDAGAKFGTASQL